MTTTLNIDLDHTFVRDDSTYEEKTFHARAIIEVENELEYKMEVSIYEDNSCTKDITDVLKSLDKSLYYDIENELRQDAESKIADIFINNYSGMEQ